MQSFSNIFFFTFKTISTSVYIKPDKDRRRCRKEMMEATRKGVFWVTRLVQYSVTCGTAIIARSRIIKTAFGFGIAAEEKKGVDFNDGGNLSTSTQSHTADAGTTSCLQLVCMHRPINLSGILANNELRKWKRRLSKVAGVKLRLKTMGKDDGKAANAEAKTDLELKLCKKRILMGEKCRALNLSGALHSDKQGILLPED